MKPRIIQSALLLSCLYSSAPVIAHHSAAVIFQLDKEIIVEGTVTDFQLGNPHARIFMDVESASGQTQKWMAEGGSRTVLLRTGWAADDVKPGDTVKIVGNPSRDGSNVIHWRTLIFPDGSQRYGEDLDPSITEDLRRRR